jgi:hypothetical protein
LGGFGLGYGLGAYSGYGPYEYPNYEPQVIVLRDRNNNDDDDNE